MIEIVNGYLINIWVSVIPITIGVLLFFFFLRRRVSERYAAFTALLVFFGTALFPYATQLWGHPTAAAFEMMALWSYDQSRKRGKRLPLLLTGFFGGMAVLCDFLALPTAAAIVLALTIEKWRRCLWLILGGAVPALLLLGYQWHYFGSPFTLPTEGFNPVYLEGELALGVFGMLSAEALFQISFGFYRGIFFQMPVLLATLVGFVLWYRRNHRDSLLWVAISGSVGTWMLISSFNGWHGGATVCGRYMIPAIPLLAVAFAELPASRITTVGLTILAIPSVINMLAVAAVSTLVFEHFRNPLFETIYPNFLAGKLHPIALPIRLQQFHPTYSQWMDSTVWNWGDIMGLTGLNRVIPLVALLVAGALAIRLTTTVVSSSD